MRVLFLSAWFPYPPDNGSKIRVYHLLRALGARHQVTLVSFAFGSARPDHLGELTESCEVIKFLRCDPFAEAPTGRLSRFMSREPVVSRPISKMRQLVESTLEQETCDVVIASTGTMATYASQAPKSVGKVLEEHNSFTRMMWDRYQAQRSLLRRLRCGASWLKTRHYEGRLFRKFDLVTMVSEEDRRYSQDTLPGYRGIVEVVANGVDCQRHRPGIAQPMPNTLVFNGSLTYGANFDAMRYFLDQIFPLIRKRIPEVRLTISGSTEGVDLARLPMVRGMHLSGHVEDIRPLVAGASACVVPIRQGGGTRIKILEAMALGTPVVATAKGAEGLQVGDGEHILLADDAQTFADRTCQLLTDPVLRQLLAANGRRLVEELYDWEKQGTRFVELVEEVAPTRVVSGI